MLCSVHCTAVSECYTIDESRNRAVCSADFSEKIKWRNGQTIIVKHILNLSWHISEIKPCLIVFSSFFSFLKSSLFSMNVSSDAFVLFAPHCKIGEYFFALTENDFFWITFLRLSCFFMLYQSFWIVYQQTVYMFHTFLIVATMCIP